MQNTDVLSQADDVHYPHVLSQANTVNTKLLYAICTMLDQRRRRWTDVVQVYTILLCLLGMLYAILVLRQANAGHYSPVLSQANAGHHTHVLSQANAVNSKLLYAICTM